MAVLAGLEPTTRCLEGSCSVQMSYRTPTRTSGVLYHNFKGRAHTILPRFVALISLCRLKKKQVGRGDGETCLFSLEIDMLETGLEPVRPRLGKRF